MFISLKMFERFLKLSMKLKTLDYETTHGAISGPDLISRLVEET